MEVKGFLVIGKNGSCRFVKNRVGLKNSEIEVKISVEIPNSLFVRPMLEANISIEGDFEHKFDMEVKQNLEDYINLNENMHLISVNVLPKENEN